MNERIRIRLSWHELILAATLGVMRQVQNLRHGRADAHGCQEEAGWQAHIEGACGEAAVAKWLGVWWHGNLGKLRAADAGSFQVRTAGKDWYRLILHPEDPDEAIFILVTSQPPHFTLRGWIKGAEGKKEEFWDDPAGGRAAYFVPQNSLHPMQELELSLWRQTS